MTMNYVLNTKNRVYHYVDTRTETFDLGKLDDDYCWIHFRFYKNDIYRLKALLKIPERVKLATRVNVAGEEALCIMLKRLAYPNRYEDLMAFFPRCQSILSQVFNFMIHFVMSSKGYLLTEVNQQWLSVANVHRFSERLVAKGSPYKNCFGFIDGTVRAICRPSREQREYYNGHKRVHALKFQSVMLPTGIIANLHGPVTGRRHDAHLLAKSQLVPKLEAKFKDEAYTPYLYGDPAYPLRPTLMVPFKGNLTRKQRQVNYKMSKIREAVEWGFEKVIQIFGFLDYKKNLKILKQEVSEYYKVAIILTNCHTALYGSQVSDFFECDSPTLEQYLEDDGMTITEDDSDAILDRCNSTV